MCIIELDPKHPYWFDCTSRVFKMQVLLRVLLLKALPRKLKTEAFPLFILVVLSSSYYHVIELSILTKI